MTALDKSGISTPTGPATPSTAITTSPSTATRFHQDDYVVINTLANGGFLVYMNGRGSALDRARSMPSTSTPARETIPSRSAAPPGVNVTIDGAAAISPSSAHAIPTTSFITGANSGNINGVKFQNVANLQGGPSFDYFVMGAAGSISGTLDGEDGINSLDFNNRTTPVTVNLRRRNRHRPRRL